MIDLTLLEKYFDSVVTKLKTKKADENLLKSLLDCFINLKRERTNLEESRAFQNKFSKELAGTNDKESLKAKLIWKCIRIN